MSRNTQSLLRRMWQAAILIVLLPLILPLVALVLSLWVLHRICLYLLVWALWLPRGKDTLFVYSDSPIWGDYMKAQVLPVIEERAVVLNWSERNKWRKWSFPAHVLRSFGGGQEFNPMVVLFRSFRRAQEFRFWPAFKHWKRGDTAPVERLRNELLIKL
jgi:hypothetical protein